MNRPAGVTSDRNAYRVVKRAGKFRVLYWGARIGPDFASELAAFAYLNLDKVQRSGGAA